MNKPRRFRVATLTKDEHGGIQCNNGKRSAYFPRRSWLGHIFSTLIAAVEGPYGDSVDGGVVPRPKEGRAAVGYLDEEVK